MYICQIDQIAWIIYTYSSLGYSNLELVPVTKEHKPKRLGSDVSMWVGECLFNGVRASAHRKHTCTALEKWQMYLLYCIMKFEYVRSSLCQICARPFRKQIEWWELQQHERERERQKQEVITKFAHDKKMPNKNRIIWSHQMFAFKVELPIIVLKDKTSVFKCGELSE